MGDKKIETAHRLYCDECGDTLVIDNVVVRDALINVENLQQLDETGEVGKVNDNGEIIDAWLATCLDHFSADEVDTLVDKDQDIVVREGNEGLHEMTDDEWEELCELRGFKKFDIQAKELLTGEPFIRAFHDEIEKAKQKLDFDPSSEDRVTYRDYPDDEELATEMTEEEAQQLDEATADFVVVSEVRHQYI